jgi:flavin reductase (DIM6/NTAB) family NADH-FMN oxidoreductase RutF
MNPEAVAALLAQVDRELWLVTAAAGDRRGGLIATFVSSASIVPAMPRMLIGIARQHHTWELIEASNAFALHLLGEEHVELVWRFGLQSGRGGDKLADLPTRAGMTGSPLWTDAPGWLDCRVEARLETGDRTVYLAAVVDGGVSRAQPLLTMRRLLQAAPADRLAELKRQLDRDSEVDARAIQEWRQRT